MCNVRGGGDGGNGKSERMRMKRERNGRERQNLWETQEIRKLGRRGDGDTRVGIKR